MLAEKTLLKTAYHFLLLLVGFDTLTYRKDYDRSPTLVGHHASMCSSLGIVEVDEKLRDALDGEALHSSETVPEKSLDDPQV